MQEGAKYDMDVLVQALCFSNRTTGTHVLVAHPCKERVRVKWGATAFTCSVTSNLKNVIMTH